MPDELNVETGAPTNPVQTEAAQPAQTNEPVTETVPTEGVEGVSDTGSEPVDVETQTPEEVEHNEPTDTDNFVMQDYKAPSELGIEDEALANAMSVIKDIDFTKKSGVDEFLKRVVTQSREAQKKYAEAEKAATEKFYSDLTESLKKDPDFGVNYENNLVIGRKLVEEMGGKEALDFANTARLFETPIMAKLFARLAKERQDAKLVRGTAPKSETPTTGTDSRGIPAFDVSNSLGSK